ncbi:C2H2-type zinc finger-containing protein [Reticulomyxa filosa]|uniref:C2H2-type zinc finger-containing protein n=1 Tax=Reticulomyxa filosa TaxID=46433 RepID=X6ND31_RETFI|nr:C2H2-type zinc finger-containing protein [Reticulomyxa filosa]|eukprot:ETO23803.1 C2H2-type zinc finger-containing protein [Reticulomyxa filosa]
MYVCNGGNRPTGDRSDEITVPDATVENPKGRDEGRKAQVVRFSGVESHVYYNKNDDNDNDENMDSPKNDRKESNDTVENNKSPSKTRPTSTTTTTTTTMTKKTFSTLPSSTNLDKSPELWVETGSNGSPLSRDQTMFPFHHLSHMDSIYDLPAVSTFDEASNAKQRYREQFGGATVRGDGPPRHATSKSIATSNPKSRSPVTDKAHRHVKSDSLGRLKKGSPIVVATTTTAIATATVVGQTHKPSANNSPSSPPANTKVGVNEKRQTKHAQAHAKEQRQEQDRNKASADPMLSPQSTSQIEPKTSSGFVFIYLCFPILIINNN